MASTATTVICRCCLKHGVSYSEMKTESFKHCGEKINMFIGYQKVTGITGKFAKVGFGDTKICENCCLQLQIAYVFRDTCLKSQGELKQQFLKMVEQNPITNPPDDVTTISDDEGEHVTQPLAKKMKVIELKQAKDLSQVIRPGIKIKNCAEPSNPTQNVPNESTPVTLPARSKCEPNRVKIVVRSRDDSKTWNLKRGPEHVVVDEKANSKCKDKTAPAADSSDSVVTITDDASPPKLKKIELSLAKCQTVLKPTDAKPVAPGAAPKMLKQVNTSLSKVPSIPTSLPDSTPKSNPKVKIRVHLGSPQVKLGDRNEPTKRPEHRNLFPQITIKRIPNPIKVKVPEATSVASKSAPLLPTAVKLQARSLEPVQKNKQAAHPPETKHVKPELLSQTRRLRSSNRKPKNPTAPDNKRMSMPAMTVVHRHKRTTPTPAEPGAPKTSGSVRVVPAAVLMSPENRKKPPTVVVAAVKPNAVKVPSPRACSLVVKKAKIDTHEAMAEKDKGQPSKLAVHCSNSSAKPKQATTEDYKQKLKLLTGQTNVKYFYCNDCKQFITNWPNSCHSCSKKNTA